MQDDRVAVFSVSRNVRGGLLAVFADQGRSGLS